MKLSKPIIFFDLETTGVRIGIDRIVQIATVKIFPDGNKESKSMYINPCMPIPESATEIHGITNEMVADAPKFNQIAKSLKEYFEGCDIGGYNSDRFDVPVLIEEFLRVNVAFPEKETNFIDAFKIEKIVNSHKLADTYKRYTGNELTDAHDALADVVATADVFFAQLEKLGEMTMHEVDLFCQGDKKRVDFAGKLYDVDGVAYWAFGKHMDKPVTYDRSYALWVLSTDFPANTKECINKILKENE